MGLVYSSVVDAPIYEVFDWHTRPGAITRLTPPWQPVRVVAEADSLRNGRAELGLPGGLRWVADHQPDAYDPPRRFVLDWNDSKGSMPTKLAITLVPVAEGTRVILDHSGFTGFKGYALSFMMKSGWGSKLRINLPAAIRGERTAAPQPA